MKLTYRVAGISRMWIRNTSVFYLVLPNPFYYYVSSWPRLTYLYLHPYHQQWANWDSKHFVTLSINIYYFCPESRLALWLLNKEDAMEITCSTPHPVPQVFQSLTGLAACASSLNLTAMLWEAQATWRGHMLVPHLTPPVELPTDICFSCQSHVWATSNVQARLCL